MNAIASGSAISDSLAGVICRPMASRPEADVQMPKKFDKAGHKLLTKVADLGCKPGGHTLAAYADDNLDMRTMQAAKYKLLLWSRNCFISCVNSFLSSIMESRLATFFQ